MPSDISNVSSAPLGYLSESFQGLWIEHSIQIQPHLFLETKNKTTKIRSRDFVAAIQSEINLQALTQLLEQIMLEDNFKVKLAMRKKAGYLQRFFSQENWEEWTENHTALGKVISFYADYVKGTSRLDVFLKRLDKATLLTANEEALQIIPQLPNQDQNQQSKISSLWSGVKNILYIIDKTITSLLPFPRGVSAQEPHDEDREEDNKLFHFVEQAYDNLKKNRDKYALTPAEYEKEMDQVYQHLISPVVGKTMFSAKERKRLREFSDAKFLYEQDKKEYDEQKAIFDAAKEEHAAKLKSGTYYIYEDLKRTPQLKSSAESEIDSKGVRTCEMKKLLIPGYFRWSIYENNWGRDTLITSGGYNYDANDQLPTADTPAIKACI